MCIILKIVFGFNEIYILKNEIVINRKVWIFLYSKKRIEKNKIDIIFLIKDSESPYYINTLGYRYYLSYDYSLKFIYLNQKDYILDTGNKFSSNEILNFFRNNNIKVKNLT